MKMKKNIVVYVSLALSTLSSNVFADIDIIEGTSGSQLKSVKINENKNTNPVPKNTLPKPVEIKKPIEKSVEKKIAPAILPETKVVTVKETVKKEELITPIIVNQPILTNKEKTFVKKDKVLNVNNKIKVNKVSKIAEQTNTKKSVKVIKPILKDKVVAKKQINKENNNNIDNAIILSNANLQVAINDGNINNQVKEFYNLASFYLQKNNTELALENAKSAFDLYSTNFSDIEEVQKYNVLLAKILLINGNTEEALSRLLTSERYIDNYNKELKSEVNKLLYMIYDKKNDIKKEYYLNNYIRLNNKANEEIFVLEAKKNIADFKNDNESKIKILEKLSTIPNYEKINDIIYELALLKMKTLKYVDAEKSLNKIISDKTGKDACPEYCLNEYITYSELNNKTKKYKDSIDYAYKVVNFYDTEDKIDENMITKSNILIADSFLNLNKIEKANKIFNKINMNNIKDDNLNFEYKKLKMNLSLKNNKIEDVKKENNELYNSNLINHKLIYGLVYNYKLNNNESEIVEAYALAIAINDLELKSYIYQNIDNNKLKDNIINAEKNNNLLEELHNNYIIYKNNNDKTNHLVLYQSVKKFIKSVN